MKPIEPKNREMNSIENEFSWLLEVRKRAGEILTYEFEALTFRLANRTTYTPDFIIVYSDHFEMAELKSRGIAEMVISKKTGKLYKKQWSSKRDDSAVKVKVAANLFPYFVWAYYYKESDGQWTKEPVN